MYLSFSVRYTYVVNPLQYYKIYTDSYVKKVGSIPLFFRKFRLNKQNLSS